MPAFFLVNKIVTGTYPQSYAPLPQSRIGLYVDRAHACRCDHRDLGGFAIPQYQDYATRSRWSDSLSRVGPLKQAIAQCAQNNNGLLTAAPCTVITGASSLVGDGFLPTNFITPTADPTMGPHLGGAVTVTAATGAIVITGSVNTAAGRVLTMAPVLAAGASAITWTATNGGAAGCNRSKTGVGT